MEDAKLLEAGKVKNLQDNILFINKRHDSFKGDLNREILVKDSLILKLKNRNAMLEQLMKKAVRIMQNPLVMRDAFKKFNLDKFVYTKDPVTQDVDHVELERHSLDRPQSDTTHSPGMKRRVHKLNDSDSESPSKKGLTSKDLILVQT